ncbi:carbonic anhydrase [Okibacterium endophyticum]
MPQKRPGKAWQEMMRGNARFVAGTPRHPRQDVEDRTRLAEAQTPDVVLFGCSDSRLAAEIIFDKGLGDLFVVRNAGQVISDSVVGSIEYAVEILHAPLIVVLGHDRCGAVRAAIDSLAPDAPELPPHIDRLISQIVPAAKRVARSSGLSEFTRGSVAEIDSTLVGREHLRDTVTELLQRSEMIAEAVAHGVLGIVGANYRLVEGTAVPDVILGIHDEQPG